MNAKLVQRLWVVVSCLFVVGGLFLDIPKESVLMEVCRCSEAPCSKMCCEKQFEHLSA